MKEKVCFYEKWGDGLLWNDRPKKKSTWKKKKLGSAISDYNSAFSSTCKLFLSRAYYLVSPAPFFNQGIPVSAIHNPFCVTWYAAAFQPVGNSILRRRLRGLARKGKKNLILVDIHNYTFFFQVLGLTFPSRRYLSSFLRICDFLYVFKNVCVPSFSGTVKKERVILSEG